MFLGCGVCFMYFFRQNLGLFKQNTLIKFNMSNHLSMNYGHYKSNAQLSNSTIEGASLKAHKVRSQGKVLEV